MNKFKSVLFSYLLIICVIFTGCADSTATSNDAGNSNLETTIQQNSNTSTDEKNNSDTSIDNKSDSDRITDNKTNSDTNTDNKSNSDKNNDNSTEKSNQKKISLSDIPAFSNESYVVINNNVPYFDKSEHTTKVFENYSPLDHLGRCGVAYANICRELMPTQKRGPIGQVKPSGWHTIKYDFVDGKYLYNRCHLIGFQLAGENANEKNLITGTRYLNVEGMLPFENMVADYVKETNNHVLYRVTPVYKGDNLVANGVEMEAWSVEDNGEGICFHVFAYNNQPGVSINYSNGESQLDGTKKSSDSNSSDKNSSKKSSSGKNNSSKKDSSDKNDSSKKSSSGGNTYSEDTYSADYIANSSTMKFHYPSCSSVSQMSDKNKVAFTGNRQELIDEGYEPCKRCNP